MKKPILYLISAAAIFAAVFFTQLSVAPTGPAEEPGGRSGAMESMEFWAGARAYPENDIPPDKFYRAYESSKRFIKQISPELTAGSTWEPVGPTNLHGRSISVAINPQNNSTVYLGTASSGLWRSYGGALGGDWEMVDLNQPATGIGAIAIDPVDTNVMYLGTGEVYRYLGTTGGILYRTTRGVYGIGILKTTDGGATWTKSLDWTYQQQRGVQAVKFNPLNSSTIWAATSEGMYKSTDAGGSWTNMWSVVMATDVIINPNDTDRVIGAFGNLASPSGGVYRSTDGGTSWLPLAGLPAYSGKTLLHDYAANPEWVYASVCDSTTGVGSLWRTTDFGDNWTQLSNYTTNNIFGVQGWYSHYVAVHPADSSRVLHASVGSSISSDGGVTFSGVSGLYSDNHAFAIDPVDPNVIFSANDDGIYRSTNFGQSFTSVGDGMQSGQLYKGLASSTTDSNIALVQSQDHIPGYIYTGTLGWGRSAVDEVGWTAIDPSNDFYMYAISRAGGTLYRSTDRGSTFGGLSSFGSAVGAWNTPFVISPANPLVIVVGKSRIFRTTTGTSPFTDISGVLDGGNPALSLGMPATSVDTLYAGMAPLVSSATVWRWVNGAGWTNVSAGLPDRYPMDIRVDPTDAATVYAAMGGFGTGHFYKSTDAGATWTNITGTIPDAPGTSIAIDPVDPDIIYAGNDISVYVSTDGGGTWSGYGEGLPDAVIVSDLSISPSNRVIRVGTYGNGMYERKMLNELPSNYFDYKAYSVIAPGDGIQIDVNTAIDPLRASFRNNGATTTPDSFDVKLRILLGASEVYSGTVHIGPLGIAEIREIAFPGGYTPTAPGSYTVQAISLQGDDDAANDTLVTTFSAIGAPTIQTYVVSKLACTYTEIVGGTTGPTGDDGQATVSLPFSFDYDGFTYDEVQISTNGWMEFGTGTPGTERGVSTGGQLGCCGGNDNGRLGRTDRPTKALGPWWEDLNANAGGSAVTYLTTGSPPFRTFTVQWKNMRAYYDFTTTLVNFQLKLYETTNEFDFSYGPVIAGTFSGSDIGAMIGMKDFIGGDYRYVDFYTGMTGLAADVTTNLSPLTDWPGPDSCYHAEPASGGTLSVGILQGWNLISRPLETPDPGVTAVFPSVIGGTTWAFDVDSGYVHPQGDTLLAGHGYWSKFPGALSQSVAGLPLDSVIVALDSGWNIIGSVDHAVAAPSGGIISSSVWGYNAGYTAAAVLTPGKGYWVKTSAAGDLTLGAAAARKPSAPGYAAYPSVTISDGTGARQTLYIAPDGADDRLAELPPVPPAGTFDVRFAGDRAAAAFSGPGAGNGTTTRDLPIRMQGAVSPVTITVDDAAAGVYTLVELSGGKVTAEHPVYPGVETAVEARDGYSLALRRVSSAELPSEFSLGQNYPNPFNPTTRFTFEVPSDARVRLTVYDALGREVKILVDRDYAPGRYAVEADFSDLATGVYVYRMSAGAFSATKKLVLLK